MKFNLSDKISEDFYKSYRVFNDKQVLEMVEYGGRGGGKSSNVFIFPILRLIKEPVDCLVLRKVANTIRTSVFYQVIWCINHLNVMHLFKVNHSRMEIIYKPRGNGFYFRGADDPMKIKSLKTLFPVAITIFEEVDQFKTWDEVDHIKQSVLRGDTDHFKLIYLFNPQRSKVHWCNQKWLFKKCEGTFIHKSDYRSNPFLPTQFFKEAEKAKKENELRYRWLYLGEPVGSDVVPFPNLIINEISDKELEDFNNIYQGIDWGFGGDAFAFTRCHYDKRRETIYIIDELYGHGFSNSYVANWILDKEYIDEYITADNNEPKSIAEMNDWGIGTFKVKKPSGSVESSIKWLGERTIVIDPVRCPNLAREFQMSDFKTDANGNLTARLDGDEHGIDSVRYAFMNEVGFRKEAKEV